MASTPGFIRLVRALLFTAAWLPFCSMAQQPVAGVSMPHTQIMNARYIVLEGDVKLVEYGPMRWFLNYPSNSYIEVKRTETELFLQPSSGQTGAFPLVVDFVARRTYMDFNKVNPWAALVAAYPTSGYSIGRVDMDWQGMRVTLDINGSSNKGWILTAYKPDGSVYKKDTALTEANVSRSIDNITFRKGSDVLTINPVAASCTMSRFPCTVRAIAPISGKEVGHLKFGTLTSDKGWVGLRTLTQVSATKWREEAGTNSSDWTEVARTPDYIELAPGRNNIGNRFYMNIGSQVESQLRTPLDLRVAHVQRQWPGQLGTVFQPVSPGMSPGFQIQNKTDYPMLVTLEQVGCLYYGIVKPGEVFQRNTGAVWFTIKASMAPDLKEPTVESCIRKPAIYGAMIAIAGVSAGTLAVPAMLVTAAGQGAAIATQQYVLANGGTATGAMASRVGVATLTNGTVAVGLFFASTGGVVPAVTAATEAAIKGSALGATLGGLRIGATELNTLYTRYTQQSDIDGITGQLTQEASVTGAYAGYPWPWKKADRVMPRYDITGGPRIKTLADGSTILLTQERPLAITKVN